jgi:hypothetical protein
MAARLSPSRTGRALLLKTCLFLFLVPILLEAVGDIGQKLRLCKIEILITVTVLNVLRVITHRVMEACRGVKAEFLIF